MFRPLLAPANDPNSYPNFFKELPYPLIGSPKLDGIRGHTYDEIGILSRTNKLIPSVQVQEDFRECLGLDGELIEGNITDHDVYNRTQSFVMSQDKFGDVTFNVFDCILDNMLKRPYFERLERLEELVNFYANPRIVTVEWTYIENEENLLHYEDRVLNEGYEGLILRDPLAAYKCGRGTWREGIIMKLKRPTDDEGLVVGLEEAFENTNEQELNELGYFKRSTKKEGMVPKGILGKFIVDFKGMIINVAPGVYSHDERKYIWEHKEEWIEKKLLKFRHFAHGVKDAPRHARALGERHLIDL